MQSVHRGKVQFGAHRRGSNISHRMAIITLKFRILSGLWLSKFRSSLGLHNFYKGREERGVHAAEWFIGVVMLGQHKNSINILLNVLLYMTAFKWYIVWQFSRWLYKHFFLIQHNIRWSVCRLIYGVSVCSSVYRSDNRDFCTSKHLSRLCTVGFVDSQKQKIKCVKPKEENS